MGIKNTEGKTILKVGINLFKADLRGADLFETNLKGADLSESDLSESDLRWADLSESDLFKADLFKADLRWSNLRGADLSESNLRDANLFKANLLEANLRGAIMPNTDEVLNNRYHIHIRPESIKIGCEKHGVDYWKDLSIKDAEKLDEGAGDWWATWKPIILLLHKKVSNI